MRRGKAINLVAGAVTLGSVGAIVLTLEGGFPPRLDPKPHEAAGWVMAGQALNLLQPGGQVTVIARDTATFKNPATDVQLASFRKALRKAHASIGSIHLLQTDPLRPVEVPPGDFLELIRKTPQGSVIVSFMGPPLLSPAQRSQLGEVKPAIVAFCSGSMSEALDLPKLFEQGLLKAAVVSRRNPSAGSAHPRSLRDHFDRWFVDLTAANVNSSSRGTAASPGSESP